jgi:hypothetical protein
MQLTEQNRTGDFIISLANRTRSMENGVLAEGQNLAAGTVLGQIVEAVGTKISGTGDGTISAVTVGPNVQAGTYVLTGKTEGANAGTFSVRAPNGNYLPDLTVAQAYATTHINLTVGDGAADWDIGDVIHVTVEPSTYVQLDPDGDDGSQIAAGILLRSTNATDAAQACVAVARDAEVKVGALLWPEGITDGEMAAAVASLNSRGILLR